jgi:pimeloyl-ACP methyl ester carboxylesterase
MSSRIVQEQRPFDVAWRAVDGLRIRYATDGSGDEKVVLFSPWPESIYAFAPVWGGLTKHFEVLAIDLPGFGQSEARDDLFAPQKMGEFIAKAFDAFGLTPVHAVGLDVGSPSVLFAVLERPELFRSLIVGAGASTYPLVVEGPLKSMIEAEALPQLNAVEVLARFLGSIRGYAVPPFVRDDYLASYEGDRLTAVRGARSRLPERPGCTRAASCVDQSPCRDRGRSQRPVRARSRRGASP